jgi:molybdopterin molybdotransferase
VTFEVFARAAIELLGGRSEAPLRFLETRLTRDFNQKAGLTRFLPASLSADGATVTPAKSGGSGDLPALARANAFLVTEPERTTWAAGDTIRVLLK